jgi:pimeloyl-ACP methyl ester carboxylesterase
MRAIEFLKGVGLAVGVGLGFATLSGAAFERISRDRAAHRYPAPGRIIDVNGHDVQLDCRGTGSPTVVFESGLDYLGSLSWDKVHDSVSTTTRACSYSRVGLLWSAPSAGAFDVDTNAATLHAALEAAGEKAPYVLVAHSLGGPYATVFTSRYPSDVAGLVMVDVAHPDQFARFEKVTGKLLMPTPGLMRFGSTMAWTGLTRVVGAGPAPASWPKVAAEVAPEFLPTSLDALAAETAAIPATLARAASAKDLGDRPFIVLSAGGPRPPEELELMQLTVEQGIRLDSVHRELAVDMAKWSTRGKLEVVSNATHYIQFDRPDAVIRAVREVMGYVIARDANTWRR